MRLLLAILVGLRLPEVVQSLITINTTLPELIVTTPDSNPRISMSVLARQPLTFESYNQSMPEKLSPADCHIHQPVLQISTFQQLAISGKDKIGSQKFVYNTKYSIEYRLTHNSLSAYIFDPQKGLVKLSEINLPEICHKQLALESSMEVGYIFSCSGIRSFRCKTTLTITKIQLERKEPFYVSSIYSREEIMVEISLDQGIIIYSVGPDYSLVAIQSIFNFTVPQTDRASGQSVANIVSVAYADEMLYVLDRDVGVVIFNRAIEGSFKYFDRLTFLNTQISDDSDYMQIIVSGRNFFVSVAWQSNCFVCEFQITSLTNSYNLVRFYKGYSQLQQILTVQNNLLVISQNSIEMFQFNRDPRIITPLNNGLSNLIFNGVYRVSHLIDRYLILATFDSVKLVQFAIKPVKIECTFQKPSSKIFTNYQPCQSQRNQDQKTPFISQPPEPDFNVYCKMAVHYHLDIKPELTDPYIWLVLILLSGFIVLVLLLLYWRDMKVRVLDKIVSEIRRINFQRLNKVHFVEEEQLPSTKLREWNELEAPEGSKSANVEDQEQDAYPDNRAISSDRDLDIPKDSN